MVPRYSENVNIVFIMRSEGEIVCEDTTYLISLVKEKADRSQRLVRGFTTGTVGHAWKGNGFKVL